MRQGRSDAETGLPGQATVGDRQQGCQEGPPKQRLLYLKAPAGVLSDWSLGLNALGQHDSLDPVLTSLSRHLEDTGRSPGSQHLK